MLHHATIDETSAIYAVFQSYPTIFPHLRFDYLQRMIRKNWCIWQDGIVITFQPYQRKVRLGTVVVPAGTYILHQIAMSKQAALGSAGRIFRAFHDHYIAPSGGLVLTVRADNAVARRFYEREGLAQLGTILWHQKGQPLPGIVYGNHVLKSLNSLEVAHDPQSLC